MRLSAEVVVRVMDDLVALRQQARSLAVEAGLSLADQARVVMCATELMENALKHASGGVCAVSVVRDGDGRVGIRIECRDEGGGIDDMDRVLHERADQEHDLLGGGLIGVRRVAERFEVESGSEGTFIRVECMDSSTLPSGVGGKR